MMQRYRLKHVARVAVAAPDGVITRWADGLSLILEEATEEQEVQ
ncbi:hypothetical protein [Dictyobacter vulcani]|nr:hypothetical protein [Dictyobacter vulcani]